MGQLCKGSVINTGQGCLNMYGVDLKLAFQATYDSNNVENVLAPTDLDTDAKVEALRNNIDPAKRVYFLSDMQNPVSVREVANQQVYDGGDVAELSKGAKTYTALLTNVSPYYEEILNSFKGKQFSVYSVDEEGNLKGTRAGDGFIRGTRISVGSLSTVWVEPTNTTAAGLTISWNIKRSEKDSNISYISANTFDLPLGDKQGLCEVSLTVSNITTTTLDLDGIVLTGFKGEDDIIYLGGDLSLYFTITDELGANVVITSVTENVINENYSFVTDLMTTGTYQLDLLGGGFAGSTTFVQP